MLARTRFDLRAQARRLTNRREIVIPNIATTRAQADSLALLYLKVVRRWIEASERIVASYERTLAEMVTDSPADTNGEIESADAAIRRLVLQLTPDLREWAFSVERVHRGRWVRNIFSATSVSLEDILGPEDVRETIDLFLARNVALVKDVSDQARGRISDAVFRGFQRRAPAREVAKDIREATGFARQRSIRIAQHQTANFGQRLNDERRRQAGIETWKWRHSGKKFPREEHKARDGKIYTDKTAPKDLPGELPNCGCSSQALLVMSG